MTTPTEKEFRSALAAHTAKHSPKETLLLLIDLTGQKAAAEVPSHQWAAVIQTINADLRKGGATETAWSKIGKSAKQFRKAFGQDTRE